MNKDEIVALLSNSYESSNETREISIKKLFQYIKQNLNEFLEILRVIIQSNIEMKFKFLSITLIRNIYQYFDQTQLEILVQKSKIFFDICASLLESEISIQSGATIAEIIIFLDNIELEIEPFIQQLISYLPSMKVKMGVFEIFSTICSEIDIESNYYLSIINPQLLNQSNQNDTIKGIQLLSQIISIKPFLFDHTNLSEIINFLLSILPISEYKSSVYLCFSTLVKNCSSFFEKNELNSLFFEQTSVEVGIDEDYDIDSAAFSVIDKLVYSQKNSSLKHIQSFLSFDSDVPQIREVSFKILRTIIINCELDEKSLFGFLGVIFAHLNDSSDRVKEASLWSLHAICYEKVISLDLVKSFFEKGNGELFEALSSFFIEINNNNNSVLAAIVCEILSLFALDNVDLYFQSIFDMFFQLISNLNFKQLIFNSNSAFVQIRIEKVLLKMCSYTFESVEIMNHILYVLITFLNETINAFDSNSESLIDLHDFLCEIIDTFFQNNIISHFDVQNFQDLISNLLNSLQKIVTPMSISAITSIFISLGDLIQSNLNLLFQLFESYPNESILSIIRYSIKQSNFSLILKFWPIIPDKHSLFFAPLIKQIEIGPTSLDESHIKIFEYFYDPLFLSDFLIILEIVISNTEHAEGWIDFGFKLLKSQGDEINNILDDNLGLIIEFMQSAIASNIQLCRKLFIDYGLLYILNYALKNPDFASGSQLLLTALNVINE